MALEKADIYLLSLESVGGQCALKGGHWPDLGQEKVRKGKGPGGAEVMLGGLEGGQPGRAETESAASVRGASWEDSPLKEGAPRTDEGKCFMKGG